MQWERRWKKMRELEQAKRGRKVSSLGAVWLLICTY